jgi:ADP-ribose pyrophosphatase YjhB (NUDIX family)
MEPLALTWAKRIQAIAQIGLTYSESPFDRERYENLRSLAAEMLAAQTQPDGGVAAQLRIDEVLACLSGYPTPKVDVRALVRVDGRVLLVQERSDGRWALPGGWADVGVSPTENAIREVAEEAGCAVTARRLLAVWDRSRHNHPAASYSAYKLFLACDHVEGEPAPGLETLAAGWFDPGALPPLSTGRVTETQIARLIHLDDHPELPPDMD